jgi:hypothetical protein
MALVGSLSASDGKFLIKDSCLVFTGSKGPGNLLNTASICYGSESQMGIGKGLSLGNGLYQSDYLSGSFIAKGGKSQGLYQSHGGDFTQTSMNNSTEGRPAILLSGTAGWARLDVTGALGSPRVGNASTVFTGSFFGLVSTTLAELSDTDISSPSGGHIIVYDGSDSYDNVAVSGDITLSNTGVAAIAAGVIVNNDINGAAAIADTKLATISTANKVALTALDIDGGSAMAALAAADLFIVDDGAGGANRKLTYNELCTSLLATASADSSGASVAKLLKTSADGDLGLNNLTVQNLTVNGTTTSVDSTVVVVKDPIIQIGAGSDGASLASDDNKDRGVEFAWYDSAHRHGFFGWDDSSGSFVVMSGAASSSEVYSGPLAKASFGQVVAAVQTSNLGGIGMINSGALEQWSDIRIQGTNKIAFNADATNTYIAADSTSPENLEIHADGHIELHADNDVRLGDNKMMSFGDTNHSASVMFMNGGSMRQLFVSSSKQVGIMSTVGLGVYNSEVGVASRLYLGASGSDNILDITSAKHSGKNTLDTVTIASKTTSAAADAGSIIFQVDAAEIVRLDDGAVNIASGKQLEIDGTSVLNATTLGTNVVASSLTSVGTLTALTVDNIVMDGAVIGHTGDTDMITLSAQTITLANDVSLVLPQGAKVQFDSTDTYIASNSDDPEDLEIHADADVLLKAGNQVLSDTSILPVTNGAASLGSDTVRWANVFTQDLWLKNSRGDWTLIEEEEYLSFRNNKNGKRYKMQMVEITGDGSYGPDINGDM